jgi:hypothetical protein
MKPLTQLYALRIVLGIVAAILCIGLLAGTQNIARNLILDPSVETGTTLPQNWFSQGNGTEWSTTYAKSGAHSLRIIVTNSSAEWKSNVILIQGSYIQTYPFQIQGFFFGNITKDSFFLSVRWFSDPQGISLLREDNIPLPVGNYLQWLLVGGAKAAPDNVESCEIVLKAVNGSGSIYGDSFDMRLSESELNPLIPGVPMSGKLLNCVSIALMVYLLSYYVLKRMFMYKVEKPQKIFTMGIGIYFITWLVSLVLFYTLISAF